MKIYPLETIISYAREHSSFYKKLYAQLGENPSLEQLPLVEQADFWDAADRDEVNTFAHIDGQIFKSGGTTGVPKHALYAAEEWRTMCEAAGIHMPLGGLKQGDKVANMFYSGSLYASFLFSYGSFLFSPLQILQYSLSGNMEIAEIAKTVEGMKINCLAGLPSKIMNVLEYMTEQKMEISYINVIYYAGETFYPDQRRRVSAILGDTVDFRSMSYASNDAGFMAYFHKESCGFNEHRSSDMFCKLELIDTETGEVITEAGRPGQIYVTSLYKLLMPIIRYPAGDMGEYTEPEGVPDRKFKLLGRSEEAARVSYVTICPEDIGYVLDKLGITYDGFQMVITHEDGRDKLTVRIAAKNEADGLLEELYNGRGVLKEAVQKGDVHIPIVEYCKLEQFEYNKRTGKLKRILDKRL